VHGEVYSQLLNGVYKAGIALLKRSAEAHAAAAEGATIAQPMRTAARRHAQPCCAAGAGVYGALAELDGRLSSRRFLLGPCLSLVDVRLAMTLLRYDAAYRAGFGLSGGRGGVLVECGYPALRGFTRDVYARIAPEVDWPSYRQYFRWAQGLPREQPLPPLPPIIASAAEPHGRDALG
jgi:glutathionyl-hydroquinone reductase